MKAPKETARREGREDKKKSLNPKSTAARGPQFQKFIGIDDAGNALAEVLQLTGKSARECAELGPHLGNGRRLVQWPDGVVAVVACNARPAALERAYRDSALLRELYRVSDEFKAELRAAAATALALVPSIGPLQ